MPVATTPRVAATVVLPKAALQQVLTNLKERGFTVLGPRLDGDAVVVGEITSTNDFPIGFTSQHSPGHYRLTRTSKGEYFAALPAPPAWKRFLNPPHSDLLRSRKTEAGWVFEPAQDVAPQYALVGIRSCELQALSIYDSLFLTSDYRDPHYSRRRESMFVLAVNCTTAVSTCFCASLGTGPRASAGFDLALTELPDAFVVTVGSEAGSDVLEGVKWHAASAFDLGRANQLVQHVEQQMSPKIDVSKLPDAIYSELDHSLWDDIALRCMSCGNCTMSCPTCFCSTVVDKSDLRGENTARVRTWDSCFAVEFSHVHGGNIRPTIRARYRQWLTHKMAASVQQFGRPACVGCGNCITWCPAGIDITEGVRALCAQTTR